MNRIARVSAACLLLVLGCSTRETPQPGSKASTSGSPSIASSSEKGGAKPAGNPEGTGRVGTTGPNGTVFGKRAPSVGDKWEEVVSMTMAMETTVGAQGKGSPQKATMEKKEVETRREEVLAVQGDAITKVGVSFVEKSSLVKEDGKERKRRSPAEGKTYVVEAKDGKVVVLVAGGGKPAPVAEAKDVKEALEMLGKPDPLLMGIPARPLKEGEEVPELGKAMREFVLLRAKGMQVSDVKVVFRGTKGEEGIFDVEVGLAALEKPLRFDMKLKGEARMRVATGQPLGTVLRGTLSVSSVEADASDLKISGTGTVEMRMDRRHL